MRFIILPLFITLAVHTVSGQSPFNYGKDKRVYFLGSDERMRLGIDLIYVVDQDLDSVAGGMGENWDVTTYSFTSEEIAVEWAPLSLPADYTYNFDSITYDLQYLNGSHYEFSGDRLKAYGGSGYGSFDWSDITVVNDTLSIVTSLCTGHCYGQPVSYSKNIFDNGRIIRTITYPSVPADSADMYLPENPDEYEAYFALLLALGDPDTLDYDYNAKGQLLNTNQREHTDDPIELLKVLNDNSESPSQYYKFHQCYIGSTLMEKFLKKKLGFAPELLLIEIYRYGVLSFKLSDKKYYPSTTMVLEQ